MHNELPSILAVSAPWNRFAEPTKLENSCNYTRSRQKKVIFFPPEQTEQIILDRIDLKVIPLELFALQQAKLKHSHEIEFIRKWGKARNWCGRKKEETNSPEKWISKLEAAQNYSDLWVCLCQDLLFSVLV